MGARDGGGRNTASRAHLDSSVSTMPRSFSRRTISSAPAEAAGGLTASGHNDDWSTPRVPCGLPGGGRRPGARASRAIAHTDRAIAHLNL